MSSEVARTGAVASRGEATLTLDQLEPASPITIAVRLVDLAGLETRLGFGVSTTPPLAPLYVTEVRADPLGAEPAQEYVEVLNSATVPLDLSEFSISDRADATGDVIERTVILAPGARALIVADSFDPDDRADAPVPPGTPLVRIGASIGSGGLRNAGEPIFLRDPEGRRVSAAPREPAPRPGVCAVRASSDGRTGRHGSFVLDAEGGCTPGAADRVPAPETPRP
jgi:hypothetical protein